MTTLKDMERLGLIRDADQAWIICVVGIAALIVIGLVLGLMVGG